MVVLDVRKGIGLAASIRLSLQCVTLPLDEGPSTPKSGSFGFVISVSVADLFSPVKSC